MQRLGWLVLACMLGCKFDSSGPGEGVAHGESSSSSESGVGETTTPGTESTTTAAPPTTSSTTRSSESTTESEATTDGESTTTTIEPIALPGFGPPVLEPGINSDRGDDDPTLRVDLLEIVFASTRPNGNDAASDLWVATRSGVEAPWSEPVRLQSLSSGSPENTPKISPDGLLISFTRVQTGSAEIFVASRPDWDTPWGNVMPVSELAQPGADETSLVGTEDLLRAYFCSNRSGNDELYLTTRTKLGGMFTAPVRLEAFDNPGRDCTPWVDARERVVVFASNRFGSGTDDDLVWARLPDGEVERVDVEFTGEREEDPWLDDGFNVLYFARGLGDGQDIYRADRLP